MALSIAGAPPAPVARPRVLMVATGFVSVATVMAFIGLIGLYLADRTAVLHNGNVWLPDGAKIALTQPNIMFLTLLMSTVTAQWAVVAIKNDDRINTYIALGLTLFLGFAYLNMAAYNWSIMGLDVNTSAVSVLIYAITGAHAVAVVLAMAFIVLMAFRAFGGQFTSRQHDGIASAAMFWHATVFCFALIWYAIYIIK
jgi:heme/copper-type cytochrome/quinol oxidase subunit 3